jgi:hypothetical protein
MSTTFKRITKLEQKQNALRNFEAGYYPAAREVLAKEKIKQDIIAIKNAENAKLFSSLPYKGGQRKTKTIRKIKRQTKKRRKKLKCRMI